MTGIERLRDIVDDGPYSGGMIHISVHKLREICEQIEAEGGVETVKSEAMEAMAFVEEHGGLDKARRELERAETWHLDKLEMYRLCTELGGVEELKKRLDTGGCRPLLGIDGSPIVPGEVYYGQSDGKRWRIDAVGVLFAWAGLSKSVRMRGEGPKRLRPEWLSREPPAPKVLDADGSEVRVGDELWHISGYGPRTVGRVSSDGSLNFERSTHSYTAECFTHRAPVIAADGKPLRVGERVWHVETGREYVVVEPSYGKTVVVRLAKYDDAEGEQYTPDQLTHERPDSWERLEEDADGIAQLFEGVDEDASADIRDLVRRARALAGGA